MQNTSRMYKSNWVQFRLFLGKTQYLECLSVCLDETFLQMTMDDLISKELENKQECSRYLGWSIYKTLEAPMPFRIGESSKMPRNCDGKIWMNEIPLFFIDLAFHVKMICFQHLKWDCCKNLTENLVFIGSTTRSIELGKPIISAF